MTFALPVSPEHRGSAPKNAAASGGPQRAFGAFAWWVLATTLAVVAWGAYVRASGSGAGCGNHWPTCNGEVIPRPRSVATVIEFAHRASSGLVLLLSAVELVWARRAFAPRHRVRRAAAAAMIFMLGEALIGAGLVLFELVAHDASLARAVSMGAHLVNTFFLLASMALAAFWSRASQPAADRAPTTGWSRARLGAREWSLALAMLAVIVVGATGAIAALGDTLFPASSLAEGMAQDLSPTAHTLVRLRVWHPIAAALSGVYLLSVATAAFARARANVEKRLAILLGAAVLAQLAAGRANRALLAPTALQLVHLLLADAVWIALVLLATVEIERARTPQSAAAPAGGAELTNR